MTTVARCVARFAAALLVCLLAGAALAQPRVPRIGIVEYGGPADSGFVRIYLAALETMGYAEPETLRAERRYA